MSLCCCSTAAGRGFFLPSILLSRRRHPLLNLRTTATVAPAPAAAAATSISSLSARQQRQVTVYVEALLDWNQRMNLTAVTDEAEVMTRHVEDSLAVLPPLERAYRARSTSGGRDTDGVSLVDVGSGAGLPGLILAVARPSWRFTLLESMKKRCTFLEHAIEAMGLSNVDVVCDRAENVGQSLDYREAYDIAAARAVAELKVLAEYCLPLVRVGGLFIAAKGHDPHEEIKNAKSAVQKLGASMLELCNVESMGPHGQRTAVIYFKERATPKKYPRLPGRSISHVPIKKSILCWKFSNR
ncbi:hypothetical protein PVAP13_4NG098700 [Panicum virgatum]|uniref:Ribosomal RNA small subunit methyltransferase G n=1 Tax=Panicum virgatum TaxID=38727 RepID=A0A8T0T7S3_PANVG|nr:hypothetical protein PVAP13_4NG098700 [Panicum virgatum]